MAAGRSAMKLTRIFFDRSAIIKMMDAKTRRALSKTGAYIRTTARSSMRRRKKASAPGQPPSVHGKGLLKKLLFFGYDSQTKSVVVGPEKLNTIINAGAPEANEYGGTFTRTYGTNLKRKKNKAKATRMRVTYKKRPFMQPAFKKHINMVAQLMAA